MSAALEREALTIRFDGVFDVPAARTLVEALSAARGADVHVDVSQVRAFDDVAVAILARAVGARPGTSVSGLWLHHLRLLRYLGIDCGADAIAASADVG